MELILLVVAELVDSLVEMELLDGDFPSHQAELLILGQIRDQIQEIIT